MELIHTADWHFYHRRVPTEHTISCIKKYLFPYLKTANMLSIAGDVFESSVSFDDEESGHILEFIADLLKMCHTHKVVLRILQGTFSHDRNQMRTFVSVHKKLGIPVDFRYIPNIAIEVIPNIGSFLYLPDNLPYREKSQVFEQVNKLMIANDLTSVDYVICHGEFNHNNYGFQNPEAYDVSDFKWCNKWILCGHIHTPSKYKNVIYAGSINRLAHNEEHPKGFWIVNGKAKFIENPDAIPFVTYEVKLDNLADILEYHSKLVTEQIPSIGSVRVICSDPNIKQAIRKHHDNHHPNVRLTFKKNKLVATDTRKPKKRELHLEIPTEKNLSTIISKHLHDKAINLSVEAIDAVITEDLTDGANAI